MRIRREMLIRAPRERVWLLFDDPDFMQRWQPTLHSRETIRGMPGKPGAVARLHYLEGGREIVMTETVTDREAPELLSGRYESDFAVNDVVNRFLATEDFATRWIMRARFRFRGWRYRLMAPFLRPAIRGRIAADMDRFRELAESAR